MNRVKVKIKRGLHWWISIEFEDLEYALDYAKSAAKDGYIVKIKIKKIKKQ